jgi:hypothetical protein
MDIPAALAVAQMLLTLTRMVAAHRDQKASE